MPPGQISPTELAVASHCPRQWLILYGVPAPPARAPHEPGPWGHRAWGRAWDACWNDWARWWATYDSPYPADGLSRCVWCRGPHSAPCPTCGGTGDGPLARISTAKPGDPDSVAQLARIADSYHRWYGAAPPPAWRFTGTQVRLTAPLVDAVGQRLRARVPLVRTATGWRHAHPADQEVVWRRVPWSLVGVLDATAEDRGTGERLIVEAKLRGERSSSGQAAATQAQAYAWLLAQTPGAPVGGVVTDLSSRRAQPDPRILRNGTLSHARTAGVLSWHYMAALTALGLDPGPYQEHLVWLREHVDPTRYQRTWQPVSAEALAAIGPELAAQAARVARWRRRCWRAPDPGELLGAFPKAAWCPPGCSVGSACRMLGPDFFSENAERD